MPLMREGLLHGLVEQLQASLVHRLLPRSCQAQFPVKHVRNYLIRSTKQGSMCLLVAQPMEEYVAVLIQPIQTSNILADDI